MRGDIHNLPSIITFWIMKIVQCEWQLFLSLNDPVILFFQVTFIVSTLAQLFLKIT